MELGERLIGELNDADLRLIRSDRKTIYNQVKETSNVLEVVSADALAAVNNEYQINQITAIASCK